MDSQTQSSSYIAPLKKLKDSCDKCSVSKVRCTKEKPSCTRCGKLGYTCFYSPARRVGRPHRSKDSSSRGNDSKESEKSLAKTVKTAIFIDEGDKLLSRFNSSSTNDNVANVRLNQHDNPPVQQQQPQRHEEEFHNANEQESSIAVQLHAVDQDCMLVIMEIFSELEIPASQLRGSLSVDADLLNMTTQTITSALRRLSNILICPCAERAENALLISAVCLTIVDIHTITIGKFHGIPGNGTMPMGVLAELSKVAKLVLQFSDRYNEYLSGQISNGNGMPLDFLPALGNLMRERLQKITNDATYWLS
ncbi:hypothetical protein N7466_009693 [Penicillium verhagenii]|uniref:uncharacterized protein n=1 Tax=Penicillium verhagenii TaxID=1562060 RepID=UPI002544ED01|nr:uncharacterized protein N7466_009693 [Penicillium verhagenii]KAJ5921367.1 hypothetical protein N7466_009693 [Penicillium verhagenii]